MKNLTIENQGQKNQAVQRPKAVMARPAPSKKWIIIANIITQAMGLIRAPY